MINPSFIQFRKTIEEVLIIDESHLNYDNIQSFLKLLPNETYTQRSIIPEDVFDDFIESTIDKMELINLNVEVLENLDFGYFINNYRNFMFSFKILNDYNDDCLLLKLTYSSQNGTDVFYSTIFSCTEYNRDKTSLFTYKHLENHYATDYLIDEVYNQIRLPIYYKNQKTEQDSTEYKVNLNMPNNIRTSRVNRTFVNVYEVIANDYINMRTAIVTDSDEVYKDGFRFYSRPFEPEEAEVGGQVVVSKLEGQINKNMPFNGSIDILGKRPGFTVGYSLGFNS